MSNKTTEEVSGVGFTPGPWYVSGVRRRIGAERFVSVVSEATQKIVVDVVYSDMTPKLHAESYADAKLIAAAPAMYEALEKAKNAIDEYRRYQNGGEMRGSYDGKSERQGLWDACGVIQSALLLAKGST